MLITLPDPTKNRAWSCRQLGQFGPEAGTVSQESWPNKGTPNPKWLKLCQSPQGISRQLRRRVVFLETKKDGNVPHYL